MKNEHTSDTVKEYIADALILLLKSKPLSQITVDELTQRAGVGRATYFRAFDTKQEAITFKFIKLWERYAAEHQLVEQRSFDLRNAVPFFEYNYSIRDILETVYCSGLQEALHESFYQIMLPETEKNDPRKTYREKFYAHGLYGLLDEWIKRGFQESPQEMAQMLTSIVTQE